MLEILVHAEIDFEDIPPTLRYLDIEVPDGIRASTIDSGALGTAWRSNPDETRRLGDEWLHGGQTALLSVPSVIVPVTWNVLINPLHQDSRRIRIARIHEHAIDPRLAR